MLCYVCDEKINKDNESEEHIIINAIGGKFDLNGKDASGKTVGANGAFVGSRADLKKK
jgi:hypothetical protein